MVATEGNRGSAVTRLSAAEWSARRSVHERRIDARTQGHLARTARGETHPVHDFLFSYYAFRPSWLRRWHPGPEVILLGQGAREFLRWEEYRETPEGVALDAGALPARRREFVDWLRRLLVTMQSRPPFFGCFGLHEWAMVYRQEPAERRHAKWPLRFAAGEIAGIVESAPVACTHFDAFRFFTGPAKPLNKVQPARATVPEHEQRGCLHANMDLYKWAFKLAPFTPSELIADCFELAWDIREIDMRASPYDFRGLGYEPIAIETASGRADYERRQREFARRGEPLRDRLIGLCERLLEPRSSAGPQVPSGSNGPPCAGGAG